ncbi:MAG: hypothetical protein Q8R02_23355 [Hyphomonadaceae bacterium]|nr:hypothetical protein [Hyphomonadaceae bacterium]
MSVMTITGAEWNRQGITREVILIGRYAIKVPRIVYGWRMFLCGLLANMQEREFARAGWPELCPVTFSIPGGWLVVMRRARPLTPAEWSDFRPYDFCNLDDRVIPAEAKYDSFGVLDGSIVAVDYGN